MQTSPETKNIAAAIIAVMKTVKNIEKSMTVGSGKNAYQGVSDKDVKSVISKAMEENGLCIVPTEITPKLQIDRWEEADAYNNGQMKQKQSVFTEVSTKYLLLHTSGEWIELSGYGHGTDTQDKAAGKATTYALKYTLLYTFMVPTGKIDDADNTHSDELPAPPKAAQTSQSAGTEKPWLNENTEAYSKALAALKTGSVTVPQIETKYRLSTAVKKKLLEGIAASN